MKQGEQKPERGGPRPGKKGKGRGKRLFEYGELRLLLLALIEARPCHGYELIKMIERRFGGSYSPSPGVIYPTLSWLEDMGYAAIEPGAGGRKLYGLTPEGRRFLEVSRGEADELMRRDVPPHLREVPLAVLDAMDELKAALRARLVGGATDEAEIARVAEIVRHAAKDVAAEG